MQMPLAPLTELFSVFRSGTEAESGITLQGVGREVFLKPVEIIPIYLEHKGFPYPLVCFLFFVFILERESTSRGEGRRERES